MIKSIIILKLFSILFITYSNADTTTILKLPDTLSDEEIAMHYYRIAKNIKSKNPDSAITMYQKALKIAEEFNFEEIKLNALYNIGAVYSEKGSITESFLYLDEAEILARELNDKKLLSYIYNRIGGNYKNVDYNKAAEFYYKSLELKRDTLDNGKTIASLLSISNTLNNLGGLYSRMKEYDKAMELFQEVVEIRAKNNFENKLTTVYQNIAWIHTTKNEFDSAFFYCDKAMEIAKKYNDEYSKLYINTKYASFYIMLTKYDTAMAFLKDASVLADKLNIENMQAYIKSHMGNICIRIKDYDKAYEYIQEAMSIYEELGQLDGISTLKKNLAHYYEETGNFKQALQVFRERVEIMDSIHHRDLARSIANMEVKYETEKKEHEIAQKNFDLERKDSRLKTQWMLIGGIGGLLVFIVIIFIILFNRFRLKQKQKQIELEKKAIETEQRLLRSQMNPHFIFNSLTSVQNYISLDDKIAAMSFLSKFAELIRNLLVNSREPTIPLEDEISTLKLYIELEQLRYKSKFDFRVSVSPELDPVTFYIPPMLIQPFVENSIKHGLQHKQSKGLLEIDFKKNESCIYCYITDNGIGREKADHLKNKTHKSLALKIIGERLEVLQQIYHSELSFEITDLKDASGTSKGTQVFIKLPFEKE